jgi:putative sterol carrier protein
LLDGASPQYLTLAPGQEESPTVTLHRTAAGWMRIAGGRLSQTSSLATRRLRIAGEWKLALRLGEMLPA